MDSEHQEAVDREYREAMKKTIKKRNWKWIPWVCVILVLLALGAGAWMLCMDVTDDIRTPDISQKASLVSAHGIVRDMLLDMQRDVAKKHNVIMDGRDIGTVVLPRATVKIFLTASAEVRAQRRLDEMLAKGQTGNFKQVLADIQQRDYQDSHRPIAPLKQAKDAVLLDTSDLDIEGVIAAMKKIVGEKISL